jgi:lipid A 4'-phosphatase
MISDSHNPSRLQRWLPIAVSLALLLLATGLIAWFDLDRRLSALAHHPDEGWALGRRQPWLWLYKYGTLPGLALALTALGGWLLGWLHPRFAPWRRQLLAVVLTAVLGAGLIVNGALKPYWGRPRPGHTQQFGGNWAYRGVWPPGTPGNGQSFPCGHCTMGFLFLSLYGFRNRSQIVAWSGLVAGLLLGGLLSAARILQGAHFLSDALWSMGVIVLTALAMHMLVHHLPDRTASPLARTPPRTRRMMTAVAVVLAAAFVIAFLTRRPYFETYQWAFPLLPRDHRVVVQTDIPVGRARTVYAANAEPRILVHSSGFGWISATCYVLGKQIRRGPDVVVHFSIEPRGFFSDLTHSIEVRLPTHLKQRMPVVFKIPGAPPGPDARNDQGIPSAPDRSGRKPSGKT